MDSYRIPTKSGASEYVDKRSRFLGLVRPVGSEDEARTIIAACKKQYHDARHNCWCYLLRDGTERYSDDGEPQGTAGQPMLNVFQRQEVWNVCCVVTRYFGGTLLGAGGLVRAYTDATKAAIEAADVVTVSVCVDIILEVPYSLYEQLCRIAEAAGTKLAESDFAENVLLTFRMLDGTQAPFLEKLTELTRGQSEIIVTAPFDAAF